MLQTNPEVTFPQLNLDLIKKIYNNQTPEILTITGEIDFGPFTDCKELFLENIKSACKKKSIYTTYRFCQHSR